MCNNLLVLYYALYYQKRTGRLSSREQERSVKEKALVQVQVQEAVEVLQAGEVALAEV